LRLAREQGRSALSAQQAVIGVSHPQVGAMVALRWHFPADIVAAIAAQQAPLPEVAPTPLPLPALVQLADHLAQALAAPDGAGSATAGAAALAPELKALCRKLGLDGPGLQTLLAQVQRDVRETLGALQPA
jgi:HD-like signal output (HDOD) protein